MPKEKRKTKKELEEYILGILIKIERLQEERAVASKEYKKRFGKEYEW